MKESTGVTGYVFFTPAQERRAVLFDRHAFAETKEQLGGFFLINASDMNEAIQIASKWPSARLGTIEVRPIEDGPPADRRYH